MKKNFNLKLLILPILLVVSVFFIIKLNPKTVEANIGQGLKEIERYDEGGLTVEIHEIYVKLTGSSKFNHVSGKLYLTNLTLVTFEALGDFKIDSQSINGTTVNYSLTSNKIYTTSDMDSDGYVFVARVKVKQIRNENCLLQIEPDKATTVETNKFNITKEAYNSSGTSKITQIKAGEAFKYKITVTGNNTIETDTVTVTDIIPSTLDIIDANTEVKGTISGQTITWNLGKFGTGTITKTLWVNVRAKTNVTGNISNTAVLRVGDKSLESGVTLPVVSPKLEITKTASKSKVAVGETFYYNITVKNTGTGATNNLTITDTFDSKYLEFVSASPSQTSSNITSSTSTINFNISPINAGGSTTIRVNFKVKTGFSENTIRNTASVEDKTTTVDVDVSKPNLTIKKEVSTSEIKRGGNFDYKITVKNTGDGAASNVVVTDQIDGNLEILSTTSGTYSNNTLTATFGSLAPNATQVITVRVKVKQTAPLGQLNNVATVKSDTTPETSDDEEITITDSKITINKVASKKTVNAGEEFTYTITVRNSGSAAASSLTIKDTLDSNLTLVDGAGASINGNTLTWTIASLSPNAEKAYTIKVKVKPDVPDNTTITNIVTAKEPGKEEVEDQEEVEVKKHNLSIEKVAFNNQNVKLIKPGEEFTYRITIRNTGSAAATNLTLSDNINSALTIVQTDGTVTGSKITWNIPTLNINESKTYTIKVRLSSSATTNTKIKNIATLTDGTETKEAEDTITVIDSDVYIKKEANVKEIKPGEEFFYRLIIGNTGNTTATAIEVMDTLPSELTFLRYETPTNVNASVSGNVQTFQIPSLNSNETITLKIYVRANSNITNTKTIKNTAILKHEDKEIPVEEEVDVIDTNVTVKKEASVDKLVVGEEFSYTITITNSGKLDAKDLTVTDTFDATKLSLIDAASGTLSDNTLTWNIASLASGETKKNILKFKVIAGNSGDTIKNKVVVTEPNKPPKEDEVTTPIEEIDIKVKKTVNASVVSKNEEYKYFITITNNSNITLTDIVLKDELDSNLIFVAGDGATNENNILTWLLSLSPEEEKTVAITVKVKENSGVKEIENKATITYREKNEETEEVIVKVEEIKNPKTGGNIIIYAIITSGGIASVLLLNYVHKRRKIYRI